MLDWSSNADSGSTSKISLHLSFYHLFHLKYIRLATPEPTWTTYKVFRRNIFHILFKSGINIQPLSNNKSYRYNAGIEWVSYTDKELPRNCGIATAVKSMHIDVYCNCCWCILRTIWRGGGKTLIDCLHAIMRGLHRKAVLFVLKPDMRAT